MVWHLPDLKESPSGIGDRVYGTFAKFLFNHFVMLFEISRDCHENVSPSGTICQLAFQHVY